MRERFISTAAELLDHDPRLAVVLADISADQFAGAAARHPDRVINVGIREQLPPADHAVAHGLDAASLRARISGFLSCETFRIARLCPLTSARKRLTLFITRW
jgi:transketolase C-terminal domain/subunit